MTIGEFSGVGTILKFYFIKRSPSNALGKSPESKFYFVLFKVTGGVRIDREWVHFQPAPITV